MFICKICKTRFTPARVRRDRLPKCCSHRCIGKLASRGRDMTAVGKLSSGSAHVHYGRNHHRWVPYGARKVQTDGYVKIKTRRGWLREHAVVLKASKGMVVHHKDGNRSNNKRNNLKIMSRGAHSSMHATEYHRQKSSAAAVSSRGCRRTFSSR